MNSLVCAVMVTYNRVEILKKTLDHVLAQTVQPDTIVVVDNSSTDGTKDFLNSLSNPKIETVFLDKNYGAGYGISTGMKHGLALKHFDYFWIMDDDTFYDQHTLSELLSNIQQSDFALLGVSGYDIKWGTKRKIRHQQKLQEVDYALVDGALISADAMRKAGTTYENFFMMCDDDEYIFRLKKHGYKIGLLNIDSFKRLHLGGQGSFTKATLWRGYYSSRNNMLILKKYFSVGKAYGYFSSQIKFLIAAALFAPDRGQRVKLRLKGIWHGIKGVEGKTLDPATLKFL